MTAEAVVRELFPKDRIAERWWSSGGAGGPWVVARSMARRRESETLDFESRAALDNDALSLITPRMSLIVVSLPMDCVGEKKLRRLREEITDNERTDLIITGF